MNIFVARPAHPKLVWDGLVALKSIFQPARWMSEPIDAIDVTDINSITSAQNVLGTGCCIYILIGRMRNVVMPIWCDTSVIRGERSRRETMHHGDACIIGDAKGPA